MTPPAARGRRRLLTWVTLVVVAGLGALLVGALTAAPQSPLDPGSAAPSGSRALVRVLARYGVPVTATTSRRTARTRAAVVVTAPDEYTDTQLRDLRRRAGVLVLVRPATRATHAVLPAADPSGATPDAEPGCAAAGPRAAGLLDVPGDAVAYTAGRSGATRCYGGLVLLAPHLVVLGSADLLTNDRLGHEGDAALAVDLLSADRTATSLAWLRPGDDAGGHGAQSVLDVFPASSFRALWWLVAVGVLLALWRARRLGAPVTEPLPVVVRAAEVVEGHGRLYLRAGARDRAAAALRDAALRRLRRALALPPSAGPGEVAAVVAPLVGRPPADVLSVLHGTAPGDDPALQRLARDLHDLEAAAGRAATTGGGHGR